MYKKVHLIAENMMFDAQNYLVEDPQIPHIICVPPFPLVKTKPTPLVSFIHSVTKVSCVSMTSEWQLTIHFTNSRINGNNNSHVPRELLGVWEGTTSSCSFFPTGTGFRLLV